MKTKDVYMYIYFSSCNVFENGCILYIFYEIKKKNERSTVMFQDTSLLNLKFIYQRTVNHIFVIFFGQSVLPSKLFDGVNSFNSDHAA